jgi:hypothetical protein
MWWEEDSRGKRVRRTAVIGTIEDYPTQELAQADVNGLRMRINEGRMRLPQQWVYANDLIDHYLNTELAADWHSHATRLVYREFLIRWTKPCWGSFNIRAVRTVAVESWLRRLRRRDGEDLGKFYEGKDTQCHECAFNHAIRYEWLEQGRNSITLVRQNAQRRSNPAVLEPFEVQIFYQSLRIPFASWSCWMSLKDCAEANCLP